MPVCRMYAYANSVRGVASLGPITSMDTAH